MKVVLENLTKVFQSRHDKGKEVVAVNNFTFTIPDGKLVGLLGPSGCGKSTTLYMICGLQKPTGGKIFFGDDDVTALAPENRGVGLVFQNYALYPHMTVKQNILFPLQNLKGEDKLSKEDMLRRAYDAARLVQIDELMDRKPSELSGGQQQRVAIARALVKMPRVLLLDEPLSNLDARLRLQTREEIRRIQRETNITTVFVTHDQEEAMSISDMIVVMKLGVVQQIGRPQDVYDSPANLFVAKFLGTPPINVFEGEVKDGKVYIGDDAVLDVPGIADEDVYVGIRPEGFVLNDNGALTCDLKSVEVMGRDVSIVSSNEHALSPLIRSIIDATSVVDTTKATVRFDIKPNKIFIFSRKRVDWKATTEPTTEFKWNPTRQTLYTEIEGKTFDLGTLKTVEAATKDATAAEKKANQPKFVKNIIKWFENKFDKIIKLFTPKAKPVEISLDTEYLCVTDTTENGAPIYFAGVQDGKLVTTIDINEAVKVSVAEAVGGATFETQEVVENTEDTEVVKEEIIVQNNGYYAYYTADDTVVYPSYTVYNAANDEQRIFLSEEEKAKCFEYMSQDEAVEALTEAEKDEAENAVENAIAEAAETTNEAGVESVVEENVKDELNGAENNDSEVK